MLLPNTQEGHEFWLYTSLFKNFSNCCISYIKKIIQTLINKIIFLKFNPRFSDKVALAKGSKAKLYPKKWSFQCKFVAFWISWNIKVFSYHHIAKAALCVGLPICLFWESHVFKLFLLYIPKGENIRCNVVNIPTYFFIIILFLIIKPA